MRPWNGPAPLRNNLRKAAFVMSEVHRLRHLADRWRRLAEVEQPRSKRRAANHSANLGFRSLIPALDPRPVVPEGSTSIGPSLQGVGRERRYPGIGLKSGVAMTMEFSGTIRDRSKKLPCPRRSAYFSIVVLIFSSLARAILGNTRTSGDQQKCSGRRNTRGSTPGKG